MFTRQEIIGRLHRSETFEEIISDLNDEAIDEVTTKIVDQVYRSQQLDKFKTDVDNGNSSVIDILVSNAAYDYANDIDFDKSYADYSENKHLSYWDTFLYNGASNDIIKTLIKNGGNADILKQVRYNKKDVRTGDQIYEDGDFQIRLHYEVNPAGSIELSEVEITKNDKRIYYWDKANGKQGADKPKNYKYAGLRYINGESVRLERYVTKTNKAVIRARDLNTGHFVSLKGV